VGGNPTRTRAESHGITPRKGHGPGQVSWVIVGTGDTTANLGSPIDAQGTTYTYTAPPTPPIYQTGTADPGSVTLRAIADFNTIVQFNVAITASSITTGFFTTASTTVALSKTLGIWAYVVGSTNNASTMQVNGTTGGSATYGTITPLPQAVFNGEYIYTAPATMPMTGNTVSITVISQADPTKSSSITITLMSS
jgi:hypothetical protein